MPDAQPIRDISDTALWAAVFRARESERPDALFRDPLARRLAGQRGFDIADGVAHAGDNSWAWVMRTHLFDILIERQTREGAGMVINLAAGLDARPYRMTLPPSLRWVEVDLPQITSYKEEILAGEKPVCSLERVSLDLAEREKRRELLLRVGREAKNPVALSEGLLIYLTEEEVGILARDLADAGVASWILDLTSPALRSMLDQTVGEATRKAGAHMRFSPAQGPDFFAAHGWKAVEVRSIFQAAISTNRVPPELQAFAGFPEPPRPWESGIWSGVCLLTRV